MNKLTKADIQDALNGFKDMETRLHIDAIKRLTNGDNKRYDDFISKDSPMITIAKNMCLGIMESIFAKE